MPYFPLLLLKAIYHYWTYFHFSKDPKHIPKRQWQLGILPARVSGILQMLRVARPNGWVLLRHARNEGVAGKFRNGGCAEVDLDWWTGGLVAPYSLPKN